MLMLHLGSSQALCCWTASDLRFQMYAVTTTGAVATNKVQKVAAPQAW
jgi:hypothetical protein